MKKYKTSVNGQFEFDLDKDQIEAINMVQGENDLHVLAENNSYEAKVLAANFDQKSYKVEVNHEVFTVKIENELDLRIKAMGFSLNSGKQIDVIKAPMPGLILDILIKEWQEVKEDEPLLILEAMKMENSLTSPRTGIIKSIHVKKGAAVEKGALLVEFEKA